MLLHLEDGPLCELDRKNNTGYFVVKIKHKVAHARTRTHYLCVPSLSSQPTELHEVVSEHRAEVVAAVGVPHPGYQGVVGHSADGQYGLHQRKVTVSEQLGVLSPLAANLPQSHVREGPDIKSTSRKSSRLLPVCMTTLFLRFDRSYHLEKSRFTLSSSLMLCRFLRDGYREDTASRLPLHSSSTSAPLWKRTSTEMGGLEAELSQLRSPLHPFTLQTPHVGGKDAAQTKVLQALLKDGVNDERQQPLTAVHPHLVTEDRGHTARHRGRDSSRASLPTPPLSSREVHRALSQALWPPARGIQNSSLTSFFLASKLTSSLTTST
ncbi:hypothetical protein EYF80_020024 [Liparis tanakae]|uniref:Uncharacterized protein n=1 Tax=Liparis tanakae TaxID=230148 RepID=A0A4Z2HXY1_9TELE|nr:hypothetical protein EYF80_020024 [Liparis tanakae]